MNIVSCDVIPGSSVRYVQRRFDGTCILTAEEVENHQYRFAKVHGMTKKEDHSLTIHHHHHHHHLYFHKSGTVQDVEKSIQIQNKQYRVQCQYSYRGK
jgi:hypothetical protein